MPRGVPACPEKTHGSASHREGGASAPPAFFFHFAPRCSRSPLPILTAVVAAVVAVCVGGVGGVGGVGWWSWWLQKRLDPIGKVQHQGVVEPQVCPQSVGWARRMMLQTRPHGGRQLPGKSSRPHRLGQRQAEGVLGEMCGLKVRSSR